AEVRLDVAVEEVGADEADAAVDVVADAAGRDDAAFVRIGGADAADAEAVTPVDVRHGETRLLNARQKRDVGDLLGRLVRFDAFDELFVGEDQPVDAHAFLVGFGNAVAARVDLLERAGKLHFVGHVRLSHRTGDDCLRKVYP